MPPDPTIVLCKLGYGGYTADSENCHRSGYGPNVWADAAPDTPMIDLTRNAAGVEQPMIPDLIWALASGGPMPKAGMPDGMLRKWGDGLVAWDKAPDPTRPNSCERLGNARALDYCAIDVYVELARRAGAWAGTVGEWLARFDKEAVNA